MIENMYGAGVFYEEAVNIALPDAYSGAVKESELHVVGYPQVELLEVRFKKKSSANTFFFYQIS